MTEKIDTIMSLILVYLIVILSLNLKNVIFFQNHFKWTFFIVLDFIFAREEWQEHTQSL